jgi:hypothetical protein
MAGLGSDGALLLGRKWLWQGSVRSQHGEARDRHYIPELKFSYSSKSFKDIQMRLQRSWLELRAAVI